MSIAKMLRRLALPSGMRMRPAVSPHPLNTVCCACLKELPRYLIGKPTCRDKACLEAFRKVRASIRRGERIPPTPTPTKPPEAP